MNLNQFKAEYEAALALQGVTVTWQEDGAPGGVPSVGGWNNPDNWVATLTRDGVSRTALVTEGRIATTGQDAAAMAAQDIWSLRWQGQMSAPNGSLGGTFFDPTVDDDLRRFYEMYPEKRPGYVRSIPPPGPATTIPTGAGHTQTTQSPPVPNGGTRVTPPADNTRSDSTLLTFWQWNYYFERQTGRPGPPPEDFGVAGNAMMTGAQWAMTVGNWYGAPVTAPKIDGGGATVGGTPTTGGVAVGGTGTTGGTPPVGGTAGGGGTPAPPTLKSFWEWNAIAEQKTGIPGDDPAHYGIMGDAQMSLAEWTALTAGYYANKPPAGGAVKPADNTLLYLGGAALALFLLNRGA